MRHFLLVLWALMFGVAGAETTFHPAVEVVTNLETTADPNYNPVLATCTAPNALMTIAWLGYNEALEQVLLMKREKTPGSGIFDDPKQIGDPAPYRTKRLFDLGPDGLACWFELNADGMYDVRSSAWHEVVTSFHNTPGSRPHTRRLPVGPTPFCRNQVTVIFLDPDSGKVRIFRLEEGCEGPFWVEMSPIAISPSYPAASFELDEGGLTSLLLRCYDPSRAGANIFYAVSIGVKPDPLAPMYWTTGIPVSSWILNARNEAMVVQPDALMHYAFTYDGTSPGILAYAQAMGNITDVTTLTSINGAPPSLICTENDTNTLNDTIMFAGASRLGPIFQVEKVKFRARFPIPDNVPVQTLEVLNAPEKTNRPADEIPIAVLGGPQPRILLVKGNRLLLLNHSSYPIPGATPTVTPSPTPSPTPYGATPSPTATPSVEGYLLLRDALIARRTPTAGQANAGDANADQVWDSADMVRFLGGGW